MADKARSLDEFPVEVQEDVNGLIHLGHLETEVKIYGHVFTIRTLKGDEELYAGILTDEYKNTLTQGKAFAWANICQAITSVDYDPDFCPNIGPDRLTNARGRFNYCTQRWYWLVANELYDEFIRLNARARIAANAVRDLSHRSQTSYSPSPDSLTDPGGSENPEILQHLDEDSTPSNVDSLPT